MRSNIFLRILSVLFAVGLLYIFFMGFFFILLPAIFFIVIPTVIAFKIYIYFLKRKAFGNQNSKSKNKSGNNAEYYEGKEYYVEVEDVEIKDAEEIE